MEKRLVTGWRLALFSILLVSVAFYLPTLTGGAVWDDFDLMSGNGFGGNNLTSAFTHPFLGHYFRPLTAATFVLDSTFARSTPIFYHQTNIIIHSVTALLVSCLAYVLTKKQTAGMLAGLFFVTQPMQVGTTAWIGGRTDSLSSLFLVAFMLSLVLYHQTQKRAWLIASTFAFFLASISKEQAFAALPAVPLSVFAFGSKKWPDAWKICIPYAVATLCFIGMWMMDAPPPSHANNSLIGTLFLGLRTASLYGLGFLFPNRQSIFTWTLENYKGPLWISLGAALLVTGGFLFRFCWLRNRQVAWVAVCGILVYIPISNIPTVPSFVAGPYRCGEAGACFACLLGIGLAWSLTPKRWPIAIPFAANLVTGGMVAWWGLHVWTSPQIFFKEAALTDPHFIVGVTNYANTVDTDGQYKTAFDLTNNLLVWIFGTEKWEELLRAKQLAAFTPDVNARLKTNVGIPDMRALGWVFNSHSGILAHLHKEADAIEVAKDSVLIAPKDSRNQFAYGKLLIKTNRKEALEHWEYALKLSPKYWQCARALGHEKMVDGNYAEAVKLLEPAMVSISWNGDAWIDLAEAKMGIRDYKGAGVALDKAAGSLFQVKEKIAKERKKLNELIAQSKKKLK
jgi:hypothetical protein